MLLVFCDATPRRSTAFFPCVGLVCFKYSHAYVHLSLLGCLLPVSLRACPRQLLQNTHLLLCPCLPQRDFSVYLVNVFDTAVAARTLAVPGGASLANLLSFYVKKQKDTKMQLADWRVRWALFLLTAN